LLQAPVKLTQIFAEFTPRYEVKVHAIQLRCSDVDLQQVLCWQQALSFVSRFSRLHRIGLGGPCGAVE